MFVIQIRVLMQLKSLYRLLYRFNKFPTLYINRALYLPNGIFIHRFSTTNPSPDTQRLLKAIFDPVLSTDLHSLSINAIDRAKSLGELSIIIYSAFDNIQSFQQASNKALSLLESASDSEVLTLLRVLFHTSKAKEFSCLNQLVDRFLHISLREDSNLSSLDTSNYFTVYAYLVENGCVKGSNLAFSPLICLFEAKITALEPAYFADILSALLQLKPIDYELNYNIIIEYVTKNLKTFKFNEIISVWHSLSSAKNIGNDLFNNFANILLADINSFAQLDSDLITKLCTGIAKCRLKDLSITKVIDNLMPQIRKLLEKENITLFECSKMLIALENYDYKCDLLVQRIAKFFKNKRDDLSKDDHYFTTIVNLCIGFGRSMYNELSVYVSLSELMLEDNFLESINTAELINIIHAFSKIRLLDNKLMLSVHRALKSKISNKLPLEMCIKYIYSVSVLEFKEFEVQKKIVEIIEGHGETAMDELQLAKVNYAAGKLGVPFNIKSNVLEGDNVNRWICGNAGRKTGRLVLPYKPLHVRRMKKVW